MLEVFVEIICSTIMVFTSYIIIRKIKISSEKLLNIRVILLLNILIWIPLFLHKINYTSTYTIIVYLINIIVYKFIFKINLIESFIFTSIMMIITFFADILTMIVMIPFVNVTELRSIWYVRIIANLIMFICSTIITSLLVKIPKVKELSRKSKNLVSVQSILFILLLIIVFSLLAYNFYTEFGFNIEYTTNIVIAVIFIILMSIYLNEKNNYAKLSNKYDSMFDYVQNFEDWIEKEQLNRHEYKNQLAAIRSMTKNKKIISKIDEVLDDTINIDQGIVNDLKILPKGGIKGIIYYKKVIATKNKVQLNINISIKRKGLISKLTNTNIEVLCKLLGIYLDNAIEAAKDTNKKLILLEIYDLKENINIIVSNTYKNNINIDNINDKGFSTKGKGRGNGLYFAKKLLSNNKNIESKQRIIDDYYIQSLKIRTNP